MMRRDTTMTHEPSVTVVPFDDEEDQKQYLTENESLKLMLGLERRKSDMRQLGALLLVLGIGAAFSAKALTALLVDGMETYSHAVMGFRLPALVATTIQTILGMVAMAVGMYTLLETPLSKRAHCIAKALVVVVNLGPISFFITVARLIKGADTPPEDNEFVPPSLGPTQTDVRFTVAMGVLSLVTVCATLIGGLTVVGLNLCAFLGGQPVDKHRGYYIIRFAYYSILIMLGGLSQLLLGGYLWMRFGKGPFDEAVHVAVYTVFFPCLTLATGIVQLLWGVWGWTRAVGWTGPRQRHVGDTSFLYGALACWIVTTLVQFIVQPSYGSDDTFDAEGATYAAVYLGFFVMPVWLDWLVRVTPTKIDPLYYGLDRTTTMKEDLLCKLFACTEGQCPHHCERPDKKKEGVFLVDLADASSLGSCSQSQDDAAVAALVTEMESAEAEELEKQHSMAIRPTESASGSSTSTRMA